MVNQATNDTTRMRVLVVHKESTLHFYRQSDNTAVKTYVEEPATRSALGEAHEQHTQAIAMIVAALRQRDIPHDVMWRGDVRSCEGYTLVVVAGGDGTVLDVARRIRGSTSAPLLGVNTDPERSTGFFCTVNSEDFGQALENLEHLPRTSINRILIELDGRTLSPALNEVVIQHEHFVGASRFELDADDAHELVRHSGVIVCGPGGQTALSWNLGCDELSFDTDELLYLTIAKRNAAWSRAKRISITSHTRAGKLFIDGEHHTVPFTLGSTVTLTIGEPITIIGNLAKKRAHYFSK